MKTLYVDFETYYDAEYSLSRMQTDAYVLDDRYQTMGVSVCVDDAAPVWFSGDELETAAFLATFDWADCAVCCHNTLFDGFILTQRFGIKPKLWMDTKSEAMELYPYLRSYSLANLCKHFGLREKGVEATKMIGRRRESLSPAEADAYGKYCVLDTELSRDLHNLFLPRMPALSLRLIDMTVRMFTEPSLIGDAAAMRTLYTEEVSRKEQVLQNSGVTKDMLMSNNTMAELLEKLGATPPTKISAKTGKVAWAFAKTDEAFTALLEHDDPSVQALVAARLGVKSTIAETRALTMLQTATRPASHKWGITGGAGSPLPVYLNYWGAKTTGRYSGGNKINWQNLPARGGTAGLRNAIMAPPGYTVLVGDSSNIELRVAMAAAGQSDVVDKLRNGEDLYCDFASKMFGRTITKADKKERMLGKIAMLSLQYGAGWRKFKEMVRQQSGEILADESAEGIVNLYRRVHGEIVQMWDRFDNVILPEIYNGNPNLVRVDVHGWCLCTGEGFGVGGGHGVVYHKLNRVEVTDQYGRLSMGWAYMMGGKPVKLYGGKAFENFCQHVARQIVMWQTARINSRYPVALSVHDEAVCVVRNDLLTEARAFMEECLSMAPPWCAGTIPLACETGVGPSYGEAK